MKDKTSPKISDCSLGYGSGKRNTVELFLNQRDAAESLGKPRELEPTKERVIVI